MKLQSVSNLFCPELCLPASWIFIPKYLYLSQCYCILCINVNYMIWQLWVIESCCCSSDEYGISNSAKHRSLNGARQALYWYWEFFIGLVMVLVVTEVAKLLVGEPRPHFLDTCHPDLVRNCTETWVANYCIKYHNSLLIEVNKCMAIKLQYIFKNSNVLLIQ